MTVNLGEILGKLHTAVKKGSVSNSTSTADSMAALAGWIVKNIYDVESFKGENRTALINAIAQACAHYKGDI